MLAKETGYLIVTLGSRPLLQSWQIIIAGQKYLSTLNEHGLQAPFSSSLTGVLPLPPVASLPQSRAQLAQAHIGSRQPHLCNPLVIDSAVRAGLAVLLVALRSIVLMLRLEHIVGARLQSCRARLVLG